MVVVSQMDLDHHQALRANIERFMTEQASEYDAEGVVVLDIAPQDHAGAAPHFVQATVETLDIDPNAGATYTADLCRDNSEVIDSDHFDVVVCTEVLEHTLDPFGAVREIQRILKPGGVVLVSTPFNFRIHGPLPDCWRFTIHGLRALFTEFDILDIDALETDDRDLMPIQYTTVARKSAGQDRQDKS